MTDRKHQTYLRDAYLEYALQMIGRRIKEPSLDIIDIIMYFGNQELRDHVNETVLPELVSKMHYIALIRLEQRLMQFRYDFFTSWLTVDKEIQLRKKRAED